MSSHTYHSALDALNAVLEARLPHTNARIYEAGGGSTSFIRLSFLKNPHITVVDIDEAQLANNHYAHQKVLGDIEKQAFPPNSFNLVVCYNVIEHLSAPDKAIRLFFQALAPGGLLLIGAPNPHSFSGMITKFTPHWFHVWYYRFILGYKCAGKPGNVPFRTVYHAIVTPSKLINFCQQLGFEVIHFREYEADHYERIAARWPLLGAVVSAIISTVSALMAGKKDLKKSDFHIVLERPAAAHARTISAFAHSPS